MPELILRLDAGSGIRVPLACQYMLQGVIYAALASENENYAGQLHTFEIQTGGNRYKLFTFSHLYGSKRVEHKQAMYRGTLRWDIRSPQRTFLETLERGFVRQGGIRLGEAFLPLCGHSIFEPVIQVSSAHVRMLTPVTTHTTREGKTTYPTPRDDCFYGQLVHNFERKWEAYYHQPPEETFTFTPICVTEKDKCVTTFKQTYITGWYGEYVLTASQAVIAFLYDSGIGDRNSQGFGMFRFVSARPAEDIAASRV